MATYVNDLRLKEIGTGESSGTWGTETNVNLELIGEALGYGTEGITTNADTHTTTVADGSTDPGRAMYIEYTGTLDSACTITIAPNTLSRLHYIENGTSGSQNIIIKQGSGATVTIPPGDTKAVYLDGAGSGAKVVDVFASFSVVDLKVQDDLTVTDDATVGGTLGVTGILTCTDDIIIGDGKTIGSASDVDAMTIAANGQVTFTQTLIGTALDISGDIDVDGTANLDIVDIDGATNIAAAVTMATNNKIQFRDDAIHISSTADGQLDLVADTEIQIAATTIDINGAIDVSGNTTLGGNLSIPATSIFYLDGAANSYITEVSGDNIQFVVGGAERFRIAPGAVTATGTITATTADNTDTLTLISTDTDAAVGPNINLYRNAGNGADSDNLATVAFAGNDDAGNATDFYRITAQISDASNGSEDVFVYHRTVVGGTERLRLSFEGDETIINEEGIDLDFRVESDSNANALIVDAGLSHVGINRAANSVVGLSINSTATNSSTFGLEVCNSSSNTKFIVRSDGFGGFYKTGNGAGFLHNTDGGITTTPDAGGHFVINEDSVDADFRVESNGNANMLFVDGGNDRVGIGTSGPTLSLDVRGTQGSPASSGTTQVGSLSIRGGGTHFMSSGMLNAAPYTGWFQGQDANNLATTYPLALNPNGGNVGINTTTPNAPLTIQTESGTGSKAALRLNNPFGFDDANTGCEIIFSQDRSASENLKMAAILSGQESAGTSTEGVLRFFTTAGSSIAEKFRIRSSGRLTFDASGTANAHGNFVGEVGSGFKALMFERTNGGGEVGSVVANASSTSYNTSSDYRLKENIDYTWDATTRLKQLKPARFNWIADETNTLVDGFLAHEVSSIVPEAISGEKDAVDADGNPDHQGIDQSKLVPLLIKTVQELEARIAALES